MLDLALEALLELYRSTGNQTYRDYVLQVVHERGWRPDLPIAHQPFNVLNYEIYQATQDAAWLPVFLEQTYTEKQTIPRTPDGIVTHPRGEKRGGGEAVLIDSMQCYVSRLAAAGAHTGDSALFDECVTQIRLHRALLRNTETGLWSQGQGWLARGDSRLSPGAWSRGHGWLIRGLEKSLRHLPHEGEETWEVTTYLREIADALLATQTQSGMWHTLLNRTPAESPPDSSGTGMIAFHLTRAHQNGFLPDAKYREAAEKASAALPSFVRPDGTVESASPGPGPLETETPWQVTSFPPDDPHGTFAILFAAAQ